MNKPLVLTPGEVALLEILLMDERRRLRNKGMSERRDSRERIMRTCDNLLDKLAHPGG